MGKNVYFDICGFVLLLVLLGTTILRRMYKGRANRGMLYLQVVALLGCVADIFSVLMDNAVEPNLTVRYLANTLYLFFHLMICFHNILPPQDHIIRLNFYLFYAQIRYKQPCRKNASCDAASITESISFSINV